MTAKPDETVEPQPESLDQAAETDTEPLEESGSGLDEIKAELAAARTEVDEMRDRWQRSAADFSNYRRRQQFEQEETSKYAAMPALIDLLPIVDSFERAFVALPGELRQLTWVQGIFQVWQLMVQMLARHGAQQIDALNQPFDPQYHEAVTHEEGEGPNTVLEVFQAGYTLHDRVLRPALVKAGPPPTDKNENEDEDPVQGDKRINDTTIWTPGKD